MPNALPVKVLLYATAMAGVGISCLAMAGTEFGVPQLYVAGGAALAGATVLGWIAIRRLAGGGPNVGRATARLKPKCFWVPPEGGPVRPATDADVARIEAKLKVKLPRTYVRLLKAQDGGEPRRGVWVAPRPVTDPENEVSSYQVYDLSGTAARGALDRTPALIEEELVPPGLVVISDDDDWNLCLDYRNLARGGEPAVVALDIENKEYRLAGSFDAFLAGMVRDLPCLVYAARGVTGKVPDMALHELHEKLDLTFEPNPTATPPCYEARHPMWRALGSGSEPAVLRYLRNDQGRGRTFPETWSYWLLQADIASQHRDDLEGALSSTSFEWVLLHAPARHPVVGFVS